VKLHSLFTEGAVFQREKKVPIWGTARNGEYITVELQGQRVTTTAQDGRWTANLRPMKAGGPYTLKVTGDNAVEVKDILIGEVFVCSGQSNMEWPLIATVDGEEAVKQSADPQLRLFLVPHAMSFTPLETVDSRWTSASPETTRNFTAVGYHFGRMLRQKLKIPIGLIETAWGGTPAEAWTSREALTSRTELTYMVKNHDAARAAFPAQKEAYERQMEKWKADAEQAKSEGKPEPKKPDPPFDPLNPWAPSILYNGMIAPLLPYGVRGAIWYQGESNAGRAYEYLTLFPKMIENWREDFQQPDFPFYFVQLAPWRAIDNKPVESEWAELRETQRQTLRILKNTGMAVITDLGDVQDIHPRKKREVGERLALWAQAKIYKMPVEYSGPVYEGIEVKDGKAYLRFSHLGGGLTTASNGAASADAKVLGFTVAGPEGRFANAEARIEGDKVVVWSAEVPYPVAVRYGWANYPVTNLYNRVGLPASPFRSDDFPFITKPRN
jgi:sialate O-acetylesterase